MLHNITIFLSIFDQIKYWLDEQKILLIWLIQTFEQQ